MRSLAQVGKSPIALHYIYANIWQMKTAKNESRNGKHRQGKVIVGCYLWESEKQDAALTAKANHWSLTEYISKCLALGNLIFIHPELEDAARADRRDIVNFAAICFEKGLGAKK